MLSCVHAMTKWRGRDESENTEELLKVLEHPATKCLGIQLDVFSKDVKDMKLMCIDSSMRWLSTLKRVDSNRLN